MPRTSRASVGGVCYHVLNRGNARNEVFHKEEDYVAFLKLLREAIERIPMRLLSYCLMPNHFHLALQTHEDGDLSRWMQWLLTSHVRRYHRHYKTSGHVWQGRFKAFPIQDDEHLLTVVRYIEGNPVRAKSLKISTAREWRWSSASRLKSDDRPDVEFAKLFPELAAERKGKRALSEETLSEVQLSLQRDRPYGDPVWREETAERLGLMSSLRPRGRPRKDAREA